MTQSKHSSQHHTIPRSKEGPNDSWNIKNKSIKEHRAWHILFYNLLPCEAIRKINEERKKKNMLLKKRRIKSWQILFGENASSQQAIEIIKEEWVLKQCFQFKECFHLNDRCPVIDLFKQGVIDEK